MKKPLCQHHDLLSLQKVTQDLNCTVVFFHSHCVFQDLATEKTIGIAKEQGGYITYSKKKIKSVLDYRHTLLIFSKAINRSSSQIWLQHKHLGHPLFSTLKSLFHVSFTKVFVESFHFASLLNTIRQLFFPIVIEVLNLLILFIQMYRDLHLFLISLVQNGLFHLLMIVLGLPGYSL